MDLLDLELARKDELPQDLTPSQMEDIKSQFHPSSTANVNMISYHIYSPNEHQVGWWQEEVDGVLKQKPVWERTVTANDGINGAIIGKIQNIDLLLGYNGNFSIQNNANNFAFPYGYSGSEDVSIFIWGTDSSPRTKDDIILNTNIGTLSRIMVAIQYTKTTDEWEEV